MGYCTSADQVILDWLEITFLGEVEIASSLGMRSWFAAVRPSTCDSILDLFKTKQNKTKTPNQ